MTQKWPQKWLLVPENVTFESTWGLKSHFWGHFWVMLGEPWKSLLSHFCLSVFEFFWGFGCWRAHRITTLAYRTGHQEGSFRDGVRKKNGVDGEDCLQKALGKIWVISRGFWSLVLSLSLFFFCSLSLSSMPDMTGRPGCRTMDMNGGSSPSYLACTLCVPLFCTLFNRGGKRRAFRLPGDSGDHFHCTVETSRGHIRFRSLSPERRKLTN